MPVSSSGVVSGVNWIRLNVAPSMCAVARRGASWRCRAALRSGRGRGRAPRPAAGRRHRSWPITTFAISIFARSRRSTRLSYGASTSSDTIQSTLPVGLRLLGRTMVAGSERGSHGSPSVPPSLSVPLTGESTPRMRYCRGDSRRRAREAGALGIRAMGTRASEFPSAPEGQPTGETGGGAAGHARHRVQEHGVHARPGATAMR